MEGLGLDDPERPVGALETGRVCDLGLARSGDTHALAAEKQLAVRKAKLTEQFKVSGIPTPQLTTMDEVSV